MGAERKKDMIRMNSRGVYEIPGLIRGSQSIITLPTSEAVMKQGVPIDGPGGGQAVFARINKPMQDVEFNMLVTMREGGREVPAVAQVTADGTMFLSKPLDMSESRAELRAMITIDETFRDYDIPVGARICDPMFPNLGDWKVLTLTDAISMDRDVFKDVSILGGPEDVLERAKVQMYEALRDGVDRDQFEYSYRKLEESLSDSELYVDENEKASVLGDLKAGKELAEEIERTGGSASTVGKVRETTIELGTEFEGHAKKLLGFAKGIGAKVRDFFSRGSAVSAAELQARGIDEETAHAIHDEAELRQESRESVRSLGEAARETAKEIKEKGIFALAAVFRKMCDIKIDHYERVQAREEVHIEAALDRIRARSRREGGAISAEARVRTFIQNIGRSIGNIGIAIGNASGSLAKAVTLGSMDFDPKPYHPFIEGNGMNVTRTALNTAMYRYDDNRLINSSLHLAQVKAKLFHERISAVPMADRAKTADRLLGHAAEAIGRSGLEGRRIEYTTLEGTPARQEWHAMEFTKDGLIVDGENMKENGYEGLSGKLSPNAMMHLFVQAEREEIVYKVGLAERAAPEIVRALNEENIRMSSDIGDAMAQSEGYVGAMSRIHKEMHDSDALMRNGYTFADKLQEKADMEAEEEEESLEDQLGEVL